jgi:hypothetical protein
MNQMVYFFHIAEGGTAVHAGERALRLERRIQPVGPGQRRAHQLRGLPEGTNRTLFRLKLDFQKVQVGLH